MNIEYFIASRISVNSKRSFSKLIVRIAIAGVMLSLAVMILSVGIIKGFKSEIKGKVRGYLGDIRVYKYDLNNSFESSPFVPGKATIATLESNPQIEYYQNFATKPAIIAVNDEVEGVNFKGVDKGYHWDFIQKNLQSGRIINFTDTIKASKEILISAFTAKRLKLKVGDNFIMHFVQTPPRRRPFTVVGIYEIGIDEIDKGFALGDLSIIRRINNWKPTDIGGIEIKVKDFNALAETSQNIAENIEMNIQAESVEQYFPGIFLWLELLNVNTKVLLLLMLIVGVINMITALLIMILERTNMIGMLKALGATNFSIIKIFLYNAMYLIGIGLFLGNALGLGLAYLQEYTHIFKLAEASYYLKFVPVEIHLWDVLLLNLTTIIVCFIVMIIPSLLVLRITPLKAIRFK